MTNKDKAEESVVEETNTPSTPREETPTPETKESEVKETVESQPAPSEPTDIDAEIPAGTSPEGAKAFKEMRLEIKRLKEEKKGRETSASALEQVVPKKSTVPPQGPIDINQFVDPETGEFRANEYNQAVNSRIYSLETALRASSQEQDEREARTSFPQLDPTSPQYDAGFDKEVAKTWLWENYSGNPLTFKQVAAEIAKSRESLSQQAKQAGAQQAMESLTKKEQASLEVAGQTSAQMGRQEVSAQEESLRERTKVGDEVALAQRLSKVPWVKRTEEEAS